MNQELTLQEPQPFTAKDIRGQVNLIQEVMKSVMQEGQHYGTIPGCGPKPTLLKPGAEKLMMTFRLAVEPEVQDMSDLDSGYVKYRVVTKVTAQSTSRFLGAGVGECSSEEDKYCWRKAICNQEYEEADPVKRREKWAKGKDGQPYQVKQIKTNPADVANTVLKMAKKRSLVDAILTVTAASDIFTQDVEDLPPEVRENGPSKPAPKPAASKPASNGPVWPWGANKGRPLSQIDDKSLSWGVDKLNEDLNSPAKKQYAAQNRNLLDAIVAEVDARRQAPDLEMMPEEAG